MFINDEGASFSATVGEFVIRQQPFNPVKETREGFTKLIKYGEVPGRARGSMLPLYTGYRPPATSLPAPPDSLVGSSPRYDQAMLSWADSSDNEDAFVLERKDGSNGSYRVVGVTCANETTYNDSTLSYATSYTYRVKSANVLGGSTFSNEIKITTANAPVAPAIPGNLRGTVGSLIQTEIVLQWDDNSDFESGFLLERKKGNETDFVEIASVSPDITTYTDYGLEPNTSYQYRIRAWFEVVRSDYSNTLSITSGAASEALIHWQLNEDFGTLASDASGKGHEGSLLNGLDFSNNSTNGILKQALTLDGFNDVIRYDSALISGYPFTLSGWVKTTKQGAGIVAYLGTSANNRYYFTIGLGFNAEARLNVRNSSANPSFISGTKPINDGTWHLITGVFESENRQTLYLDGALVGTLEDTLQFVATEITRFSAGVLDRDAPGDRVRGQLDDIRLYNKALSETEVLALMDNISPYRPFNLAGELISDEEIRLCWSFNSRGSDSIRIERSVANASNYMVINTLSGSDTTFVDEEVGVGNIYYYRLLAVNEFGVSDYSNSVLVSNGVTTQPILQWSLEETSGISAIDSNGNNGMLLNGLNFENNSVEGKVGKALEFTGADKLVRSSGSPVSGYPFTMSAWVKTTSNSYMTIAYLGKSTVNDVLFALNINNGVPQINARNTVTQSSQATTAVNDGNWHLVTGVFESPTSHKIYVDSTLEAEQVNSVNYNAGINRFSAGALDRALIANPFTGMLDEVRLYDRAIDLGEISLLVREGISNNIPVTGISLNIEADTILIGETIQLIASVTPANASNNAVEWSSSNPAVLGVDQNGNVVGISAGSATIVVSTQEGNFADSCQIRVNTLTTDPLDIAFYEFTDSSIQSTDTVQNIIADNFITGVGLSGGTSVTSVMRVNQTVTSISIDEAVAEQDYFEFTVTPDPGLSLNLLYLSFIAKRGKRAPNLVRVYCSADNYSSYYDANILASKPYESYLWELSTPHFQGLTSAVTFRIYVYGANGGDIYKLFYLDNVKLNATVSGNVQVSGSSQRLFLQILIKKL